MDKHRLSDEVTERRPVADSNEPAVTADSSRRRLIKHAALAAPAIITLRSGAALAATTCTGIINRGGPAQAGEYCATDATPDNACPSEKVNEITNPVECQPQEPETTCDCTGGVVLSSAAYASLNG